MNILTLTPNPSGGYPQIQTWRGETPPDGYAEVVCDATAYCEYRGFVIPTITDGRVAAFEGNQAALDAYLAEHPDTEPPPTPEERIAELETQAAQYGEIIIELAYSVTLLELGML